MSLPGHPIHPHAGHSQGQPDEHPSAPLSQDQFAGNEEEDEAAGHHDASAASQSGGGATGSGSGSTPTALPTPASSSSSSSHADGLGRTSTGDVVTMRVLLNSKGAGVVIGKGGKTVEEMRENSGTKAGVSKAVEGVNDRVLTVVGTVPQVAQAMYCLAEILVATPCMSFQPPLPPDHTMIRLLVPNAVMGSIIGRGGIRIKNIQEKNGVRLVASKEALPNSTERLTDITGTPSGIRGAVSDIAQSFQDEWERVTNSTVLYDPWVRQRSGGNQGGGVGGAGGMGFGNVSAAGLGGHHNQQHHHHSHHLGGQGGTTPSPPSLHPHHASGLHPSQVVGMNNPMGGGGGPAAAAAAYRLPYGSPHHATMAGGAPSHYGATGGAPGGPAGMLPGANNSGSNLAGMGSGSNATGGGGRFGSRGLNNNGMGGGNGTTSMRSGGGNGDYIPKSEDPNAITQTLSIPSDLVGCIIGKAGSRIGDIRDKSGSKISISKIPNEAGDRIFTIVGTRPQNELALKLLYGQLEEEKDRRTVLEQQKVAQE